MKKLVAILILFSVAAQAQGKNTKIACYYGDGTRNGQELIFESVDGIDLARPGKIAAVQLRINGDPEPTTFLVQTVKTDFGRSVKYGHRGQFFVSDIGLSVDTDEHGQLLGVSGTWVTDAPPVIKLRCHF